MKVHNTTTLPGGRRLLLVENDLLAEPADAIVNAANGYLAHGGGVAAAIARAAGPALEAEGRAYVERNGPISTGDAVVTTAGALDFEGVIHAVGPRWGEGDEEEKLAGAITSALRRADERGWRSVSVPAISSGIFSVPLDVCARAYVDGALRHFAERPESSVEEVRFCLLGGPLVDLVREQMEAAETHGPTAPDSSP